MTTAEVAALRCRALQHAHLARRPTCAQSEAWARDPASFEHLERSVEKLQKELDRRAAR